MYKKLRVFPTLLGLIASLALSCSTVESTKPSSAAAQFEKANRRYEAHNFLGAIEQFKVLLAQFPGSKYAEPATFFLGKSYYESKEFPLAEVELERVTRDFPRGIYAEEATFLLGMCAYKERRSAAYDQTSTEKAISLLQNYVTLYPEGAFTAPALQRIAECRSILAQKIYQSGVLYIKLGDFGAARTCFDEVCDKYGESPWAAWAALGIAESYQRERNWQKALEGYENLTKSNASGRVLKIARERLKEVEGKASRGK